MNNMTGYGNPYVPYVQPPMPQITYPPIASKNVIAGRSVNIENDIAPADVPMDGSISVFPKADGSVIFVKSFNGDGTINTRYFIPAPEDYKENISTEQVDKISMDDVMSALSDLTQQVNNMQDTLNLISNRPNKSNNYNKNHNNQQNKKGSDVDA